MIKMGDAAKVNHVGRVRFVAMSRLTTALFIAFALSAPALSQEQAVESSAVELDQRIAQLKNKVVAWRRDIHKNPELSNREFRTAELVARHLRSLGMEVKTGVAHTGVVGVLRGGKPGRVVALRADMDALPVTEEVDVPFASTVRTTYNDQQVGVMHACGHDAHVAILMGTAELLSGMRDRLAGSVMFIFQPAEEGAPKGEEGGAELMIRAGVLDNPIPDAIFALHVFPFDTGTLWYRSGSAMASADQLRIVVRGRQTHGAMPWAGVDPIVVAAQIVMGLQTITSRQVNVTTAPAIVSIGSVHGGVRSNIIPDQVEMVGTIRTFDTAMRDDIHARVKNTAESIAKSAGAVAEVAIERGYPVTINDAGLTERMAPTFRKVVGPDRVFTAPLITGAEDFAYFQQR
ncbi:MAG: amidohydrolase, partial [Burkholderiales bacterium]